MKKEKKIGVRIDDPRLERWKKGIKMLNYDMSEFIIEATDFYMEKKLKGFKRNLEKEIFEIQLLENKKELLKKKKNS